MTRTIRTGYWDIPGPETTRGGQHVGTARGVLVYDEDLQLGVLSFSERSQHKSLAEANALLDLAAEVKPGALPKGHPMTPSEIAKAVEVARDYMGIAADIKADGSDRDPDIDPSLQRVMAEALLALAERCGELEARAASFVDAVNAAVRANEQRGKGGQQVPFHGDFASATRNLASSLRWAAFGQAMFEAGREYHAAASDDEPWCPNIDGRAPGWREL